MVTRKVITFGTREEAEAHAAKVDEAMGYPAIGEGVCRAVHVGKGRHATHPKCCTVSHAKPIEGATGYAYPSDDKVWALRDPQVRETLATEAEIDADAFERKPEPAPDVVKSR